MNLQGVVVKHQVFGEGVINQYDGKKIVVSFPQGERKFLYPDAFNAFVVAEDATIQAQIMEEIVAARKAEDEKKQAEEASRRASTEHRKAADVEQCQRIVSSKSKTNKPVVKSQRVAGKPMVFYVFQGNTFDSGSRGEYIWAPISNKDGMSFHHWDRLLDVREGDIILHGDSGMIKAISTARGKCYECKRPEEIKIEDLWDTDGRRVDCNYIIIRNPIKTSNHIEDILKYCTVKYAPFDKTGNGNMGYLFEINNDLARIFVFATLRANPDLILNKVIDNFLQEE
jgi:hypothetical protein